MVQQLSIATDLICTFFLVSQTLGLSLVLHGISVKAGTERGLLMASVVHSSVLLIDLLSRDTIFQILAHCMKV